MIIGVDAGALSITDERLKVGVWRVSVSLLKQLGKIDRENEYRLYSFLPIDTSLMAEFGPRITNLVVRPKIGWFSLSIPIELRRHPVDFFLGLSQAVPFGAEKSIGFVYDLGFLHHPEVYQNSAKRLARQTEELIKRSTNIVAISESTAKDLVNHYHLSSKKITVAYPGVDERFSFKGDKFVGKNPYFLFVGALKRGKNLPFAIRAFANFLKSSEKTYDFLIIGGDYWRDPEIDETIKKYHLEKRVKLLGFVSDIELPKFYRGAISLIIPSLWEGFCLPAAEAMASGCPVICSGVGALPEIISKAGITVSPTEEKELSEAMSIISANKIKRNKLIKDGLIRSEIFSWSTFGKKVLENISRS